MSTEQKRFLGHLLVGLTFAALALRLPRNLFVDCAVAGYFLLLADSFSRTRRSPDERAENFRIGALIFLFPLIIMPMASSMECAIRPHVWDAALRAADLRLHLDGFALSRFCVEHGWARGLAGMVYAVLPLAIALAWLTSRSFTFLRGALLGAIAALPIYLLCPGVGPQYVFNNWPFSGAFVASAAGAHPRNCMPSMHFTWAALAALNAPRRWRPFFAVYAVLMGLATIAGGEHYAVDVVAAFPFTLAVQWAAVRFFTRKDAAVDFRLWSGGAEAAPLRDCEVPRGKVAARSGLVGGVEGGLND